MAKKASRLLAVALAMLCLCTACTPFSQAGPQTSAPQSQQQQPNQPDPLEEPVSGLLLDVILEDAVITTLDPALCTTWAEYTIVSHLFQGLYAWRQEDGAPTLTPAAATGYELSVDTNGRATYTFHLREGALWSDGAAVTAGDFEYAWKRLAGMLPGGTGCGLLDGIAGAEEIRQGLLPASALAVDARNDATLTVTLVAEDSGFLERTALPGLYPVRQDAVARTEQDWSLVDSLFAGNGPYRLAALDNTQATLRTVEEEGEGSSQIALAFADTAGEGNNLGGKTEPHVQIAPGKGDALAESGWLYTLAAAKTDLDEEQAGLLVEALAAAPSRESLADLSAHTTAVGYPGGTVETARETLSAAGFGGGEGWPDNALLLVPDNDFGITLGKALVAAWEQELSLTVQVHPGPPAEPDTHALLLQLTLAHQSLVDGTAAPLLAAQLGYTTAEGVQGLLHTPCGLYLGGCTLDEAGTP